MRKFAFLFFCLVSTIALSATGVVTWTAPTQRESGAALPTNQISGYRIEWGTCNGSAFGTKAGEAVIPATPLTHSVTGLNDGATYCFRMYTRDTSNPVLESVATNVVSRAFPQSPPNPPGGLVVTALTAYTVVKQNNRFVALPVGVVPEGTQCDVKEGAIAGGVTYYAVPAAKVAWSGSVRSVVVVARCG